MRAPQDTNHPCAKPDQAESQQRQRPNANGKRFDIIEDDIA